MKLLTGIFLFSFLIGVFAKAASGFKFNSLNLIRHSRQKRQTSSLCIRNETYPCTQTRIDPLPSYCIYPTYQYQWFCRPRRRQIRTICTRQILECCSGFVKIGENCIAENNQVALQSVCSATETSLSFSSGVLTSPNYPNFYPPNSDCLWSLERSPGSIILIQIMNLQIEPARRRCVFLGGCTQECSGDWLSIRDNDQSQRFCGSHTDVINFLSFRGNVTIRFRSDEVNFYSGFRLTYRVQQLLTTTTTPTPNSPTRPSSLAFLPTVLSSTRPVSTLPSITPSESRRQIICLGDQILVTRASVCSQHCFNGTVTDVNCQSILRNYRREACVCPSDRPVVFGRQCLTPTQCAATYRPPRVCHGGMIPIECLPTCSLTCENKDDPPCPFPPRSNCVSGCMCPPNRPVNHNGQCIARENCPQRQEPTFTCGTQFYRPNVKIVGGETAIRGSWPWAVQIIRLSSSPRREKFQCGGTLICQRWVLTAAHCFQNDQGVGFILNRQAYRIQIGKYNRLSENGSHIVIQTPAEIILHPRYDSFRTLNDVALIRLAQPVQFSKYIRPACVPSYIPLGNRPRWTPSGSVCYVIGWGETLGRGPSNRFLKQVALTVRLSTWCKSRYEYYNDNISLCVGGRTENDSCTGDSGGPLLCRHNGKWYVDGITSYGLECGAVGSPGVYTRVTAYSDWIRQRIDPGCANLSQQWIQTD